MELFSNEGVIWMVLAIAGVIVECLTLSFGAVCASVGALGALVAYYIGASGTVQVVVFAVLTALSILFIRPMAIRLLSQDKGLRTGVDAMIGRTAMVTEAIGVGKDGLATIDGVQWTARMDGEANVGQMVRIKSVSGTVLMVESL